MKDDFDTDSDSDPESASSALYHERHAFGQFKRSNRTGIHMTLRPISFTKIYLQAACGNEMVLPLAEIAGATEKEKADLTTEGKEMHRGEDRP